MYQYRSNVWQSSQHLIPSLYSKPMKAIPTAPNATGTAVAPANPEELSVLFADAPSALFISLSAASLGDEDIPDPTAVADTVLCAPSAEASCALASAKALLCRFCSELTSALRLLPSAPVAVAASADNVAIAAEAAALALLTILVISGFESREDARSGKLADARPGTREEAAAEKSAGVLESC